MAPPTKTRARPRDPLRTYQFRLKLEPGGAQNYIAGVRSVSGLSWTVSAHETWSGGNNVHRYATPDRVSWEPITLEQGIALDSTLEEWALAARNHHYHRGAADGAVKRTLRIDVWDHTLHGAEVKDSEDTTRVRKYTVKNAWVSNFVALPKLDAMSSEIAFQSFEIIHEGWTES